MASTVPEKHRTTRQRTAVTEALAGVDDFVSAQELHRRLHGVGAKVSLATVYRLLQSMADAGQVDVLRNTDNEAVYRKCRAEHHHHHLVCRNCGRTVEVEAPAVESWAARVAAEHGYASPTHTVEIYGLCPACAQLRGNVPAGDGLASGGVASGGVTAGPPGTP